MFIHVNPSEQQTEKEKWLEQSLIRSHASSRAHSHKRRLAELTESSKGQKGLNSCDQFLSVDLAFEVVELSHTTGLASCSNHLPQKRQRQNDTQTPVHSKRHKSVNTDDNESQSIREVTTLTIANKLNDSFEEGRSLQFFREKTATEWSVWYDADFWRVLALQAATNNPSVRHALTSLGALHESLDTIATEEKTRCRLLSMTQCGKALTCLIRDYDRMSISAILTTYAAIAAVTGFTNGPFYLQAVQTQFDILDNLKQCPTQTTSTDRKYITQYLEPSIERQRSETGQYVDLLWCLRATSAAMFYDSSPISIPTQFASFHQARASLDRVLNFITYQVKTRHDCLDQIPQSVKIYFNLWLQSLEQYESKCLSNDLTSKSSPSMCENSQYDVNHNSTQRNLLTISLLRVSARIGMLMIETMNSDSECIFDAYLPQYQELAFVFEAVLNFHANKAASCSFHMASSLLCLVGNAASRWCRDPTTRRQLIALLYRAQCRESLEGAVVWAEYCRCTMELEEKGLSTVPMRAADIPARSRVRVHFASFFHKQSVRQVRYHVWPYRTQDFKDFYILKLGSGKYQEECPKGMTGDTKPSLVIGRGFMSWAIQPDSKQYYTVRNPRFYFPMPRI